jgi:hypothetical protein
METSKVLLKVEYLVETEDMSDSEYYDQEERVFLVTEQMIMDLVSEHADLNPGEEISFDNFWVNQVLF